MGKMTIQEIAAILVQKNGFEKREANAFASAMFALIQERLETDQLVKVKGLGTFKIIDVEARESVSVRTGERVTINGHSKVSFTPDATMKELVNKPFSQFETVVLNEGVEFADIKEEQEAVSEQEVVPEQIVVPEQDTISQALMEDELSEIVAVVDEPVTEQPVFDEESSSDEAPSSDEDPSSDEAPSSDEESASAEQPVDDDVPEEERSRGRWILAAFGILTLMALSAAGGYYYGFQHATRSVAPDTVVVHDTVQAVPLDTLPEGTAKDEPDQQPAQLQPAPAAAKVEPIAPPAKVEPAVKPADKPATKPDAETPDKYAQKDVRVRLGAYRIVGLDHEVKVLAGQTFYSICRAHLGPDMECYVEVFNDLPQNPKVKVGQVIKIPKLQLKKRRKQ